MKYIILVIMLVAAFSAKAGIVSDTIPYWNISYGKTVIVQGNFQTAQTIRHELTVKSGSVKDLTVSFVYDAQPKTSSLVIKEKNEELRTLDQDPVMGPNFFVPIRELISTHQPDVRYELDFYYSDDRGQKNRKIATIIFIFK